MVISKWRVGWNGALGEKCKARPKEGKRRKEPSMTIESKARVLKGRDFELFTDISFVYRSKNKFVSASGPTIGLRAAPP